MARWRRPRSRRRTKVRTRMSRRRTARVGCPAEAQALEPSRQNRNLGLEGPGGRELHVRAAHRRQVHRLMHLWRAGDQARVDDYVDAWGLQRSALFGQILQALIELAASGSEERAILEAISNHVASRGDVRAPRQRPLPLGGM